MIPPETVARILDTAQIVDVVSDFVSLKRRGANFVACCPFHNEKTPSFYVSPSKGIYKCFGCGKSGTAVGFVMEHETLTYPEALRYLARKYGIEVVEKEESAEDIAARQYNESLLLTMDFALDFFKARLKEGEGRSVGYRYFREVRGLTDETIEKWGLGWAPSGRHALAEAAAAKGFKEEYLVDTGLVRKHDDGHITDHFFERVIFPFHSLTGRVIAFGGRTLKSDKTIPKYVNSPETKIYDKSRSLYGIYFAKSEIAKENRCFLVEGYLDVLSMHQLGIRNVVASSGTSLTVQQVRLIRKFTENVTIMYDGDSAGIHAAMRGIGLVLQEGLNVKVVLLPDGDDPDSYARKHTLEEVKGFISANERDFIEFKTDLLLEETGGDPIRRASLINDIADTIALIPDAVKRTVYAQASAQRFDIDSQIIFGRIRKTREKMKEDARKEAAREQRRQSYGEDPEAGSYQPQAEAQAPVPDAASTAFEDPFLQPSEKELLEFILKDGLSPLEFETDSDFYDPDNIWTVAEFIRSAFEEDDHQFVNLVYRRAYDAYFALYDGDASLTQDDIVRAMMDGQDRVTADLTATLTQESYQLTVKNFAAAMTAPSTKLVMYVPKAILVYQLKRLEERGRELSARLKVVGEADMKNLLGEIQRVTQMRKAVDERLGRVQ